MVRNNIGINIQSFVFGIENYPFFQVIHSFDFVQDVSAADTQWKQGIEILWVEFYGIHKTCYGFLILIILLKDTAKYTPPLTIFRLLLSISLQSKNSFIVQAFIDKI